MATAAGSVTVGVLGELRLVVRLQQQADHFADELVRPRWQTQRPLLPVLLWDVVPPDRSKPVALVTQRVDDALDLAQGHAVRGFRVGSGGHRSLVGVDAPVGQQVQLRVEQLPIQLIQRQAAPAAFTEDLQDRFGALHYAYLPVPKCPVACAPSPCGRLSAEVRRRRGALAGPFPTPPSRTRRDPFRSPGSPATIPRLLAVGH